MWCVWAGISIPITTCASVPWEREGMCACWLSRKRAPQEKKRKKQGFCDYVARRWQLHYKVKVKHRPKFQGHWCQPFSWHLTLTKKIIVVVPTTTGQLSAYKRHSLTMIGVWELWLESENTDSDTRKCDLISNFFVMFVPQSVSCLTGQCMCACVTNLHYCKLTSWEDWYRPLVLGRCSHLIFFLTACNLGQGEKSA